MVARVPIMFAVTLWSHISFPSLQAHATATAVEGERSPNKEAANTQLAIFEWKRGDSIRQYISQPMRPALIKNSPVNGWRSAKWTPTTLSGMLGKAKIPVKNSTGNVFHMGCCALHRVELREAIERCEAGSEEEYIYFSGPLSHFGKVWAGREINLDMFDMKEVPIDAAKEAGDVILKAHLWIGSKGVVTPTHFDEMHNFFVQIYGSKTFTLLPPSAWARLQLYPKFHHQHRNVIADLEDEKTFKSLFSDPSSGMMTVTLSAGDLLYVPPLWFHRVETISKTSISANIWSASKTVHGANKAWLESFPVDVDWGFVETIRVISEFLRQLIKAILPKERILSYVTELKQARYESLYRFGENITTACPFEIYEESHEIKEHNKYLEQVESEAPSFLSQTDIKKTAYEMWCNPSEKTTKKAAEYVPNVKRHFDGLDQGMAEIYLGNYIEDLASQIVGFEEIVKYLESCISHPLSEK